jgi:hypothetical protein
VTRDEVERDHKEIPRDNNFIYYCSCPGLLEARASIPAKAIAKREQAARAGVRVWRAFYSFGFKLKTYALISNSPGTRNGGRRENRNEARSMWRLRVEDVPTVQPATTSDPPNTMRRLSRQTLDRAPR